MREFVEEKAKARGVQNIDDIDNFLMYIDFRFESKERTVRISIVPITELIGKPTLPMPETVQLLVAFMNDTSKWTPQIRKECKKSGYNVITFGGAAGTPVEYLQKSYEEQLQHAWIDQKMQEYKVDREEANALLLLNYLSALMVIPTFLQNMTEGTPIQTPDLSRLMVNIHSAMIKAIRNQSNPINTFTGWYQASGNWLYCSESEIKSELLTKGYIITPQYFNADSTTERTKHGDLVI